MRFIHASIVSLLASVAWSQSIANGVSQFPSCALSCLTTAISETGCGLTDYACQCGSAKFGIETSVNPCVLKSCSTSDALTVQRISSQICSIQNGGAVEAISPEAHIELRNPVAAPIPAPAAATPVSNIGSFSPTTSTETPAVAAATATSAGVLTSSPSASASPATVSSSPGDKLHVEGVVVGLGALLALVL